MFMSSLHVNTSDRLKCQPFWYHPRVARLSETGHSQWLPHGLECSATIRSECAFSSCLSPRTEDSSVSFIILGCDLTIYCALSVRPLFTADVYWLPQTVFIVTFVWWSCSIYCNSATLIIFTATTTTTQTNSAWPSSADNMLVQRGT